MKIRITVISALKKVLIKDKQDLKQSIVIFEGNVRSMPTFLSDIGKELKSLKLCGKDGSMFANPEIKDHKESLRDYVARTVPKLTADFEIQECATTSLVLTIEYLGGEAVSLVDEKALAGKTAALLDKFDNKNTKRGYLRMG